MEPQRGRRRRSDDPRAAAPKAGRSLAEELEHERLVQRALREFEGRRALVEGLWGWESLGGHIVVVARACKTLRARW